MTSSTTSWTRVTYEVYDSGWGCTWRSGQMLVQNAIGEAGAAPPKMGEPGFGQWAGPFRVAHRNAKQVRGVVVVGESTECLHTEDKLILAPVRLGLRNIDDAYARRIRELVHFPGFCGIVGGVQRRSYFITTIDDDGRALCIDPHITRIHNVDIIKEADLIKIPFHSFAPTMTLGFRRPTHDHFVPVLLHHLHLLPLG